MASGVEPLSATLVEVMTTTGLSALAHFSKSDLVCVIVLGVLAAAGNIVGSGLGHTLALNPPLFAGTLIFEVLRYGWSTRLVWMALTTLAAWFGALAPIFFIP